ncbi:MAG: L-seryl-tRNA(Sec) selenium transferase, partial [Planctomycetes bacterium]|nr:L-seryl-tRNA(Sec) selenium transferase [Planctomycetota bacterium]
MSESAEDRSPELALRDLPSVDHLLKQPAISNLLDEFPRSELVRAVRKAVDACRQAIVSGRACRADVPDLALAVRQTLYERSRPNLRRVINATGIIMHTGLGRAPLATEAIEAITDVAAGYSNLELNLETGKRGDRHAHVKELLCELTGAEDALVVNNNAAATYLTLNTLAKGREAIISRGELVEIGGSYRMPDIMAAADCRMVEVGATNRTRIGDYERAITDATAVLLHVHTSNYRILGFVHSPTLSELAELGQRQRLIVIDDLGSGLLADIDAATADEDGNQDPAPPEWDEPSVLESVLAGMDVTLFSGDKLLGGPQAGIILGRRELTERIRANPLMRTFRPDKMTLAGLEATLRLYRDPETLRRKLPVLRMLTARPSALRPLAEDIEQRIARMVPSMKVDCRPDSSLAGGGSLPTVEFPTWVVTAGHATLSGR